MFASGMDEDATGQVHIKDVDPTTFEHFLKFLYTGSGKYSEKYIILKLNLVNYLQRRFIIKLKRRTPPEMTK